MTRLLFHIDLGSLSFGLVAWDGKVIQAAPVARWTLGRQIVEVIFYYERRGASITWQPDPAALPREQNQPANHDQPNP